jgi:hypothetical protein
MNKHLIPKAEFAALLGSANQDNASKMGDRFFKAKGMKRPLHDYVFAFVTAHPEQFSAPDK